MKKKTLLALRIPGGLLAFVLSYYFFTSRIPDTAHTVMLMYAIACASGGVALLAWNFPRLVVIVLLSLVVGSVYGADVYEVVMGQKHWFRLVPLPVLLLISVFASSRHDNTA